MLDGEVTSLALFWQVERRDGVGLALTSHDAPLTLGGVRFEPAPGITPSAIRAELGIAGRTSEVGGALSSGAISEADIFAGRWDGAALTLTVADWERPDDDAMELLSGELGQVESKEGEFAADLLGVAAKLERPVCPLTSPECRAELGDPRCGVDMAGRRVRAKVVSVSGLDLIIDRPLDEPFRFGSVRFLGGPANGERRTILAATEGQLRLRSAPSSDIEAGTPVEIVEGCDKRLATCAARFANAANFRGEPHLPGNDLLTRYPGA